MNLFFMIGLMASLFGLNYLILVPNEVGTTTLAVTTDKTRRKIQQFYTQGEGQHQLTVLNKTPQDLLKTTLLVGSFLSFLAVIVAYKLLGLFSLILAVPAFFFGMIITRNDLKLKFAAWQMEMRKGLSSLLEFMRAFLKLEGVTTKEALNQSIKNLPNPLKSELEKTMKSLAESGDPKAAFDDLADKVKDRMFYAVCFRLGVGWNSRITPEMCDDLIDQIENDKDIQSTKTSVNKSAVFSGLCMLGVLALVIIYGYPAAKLMGLNFRIGG
ncbi:hypothetical protein V6C32_10830 [Desulforamulus ruminis]|uniref:type II secretion system F family protein n=1 Tax=Desulforamulus ruminis TaxID=1564 RepID=UPI002FD9343E